MRTTKKELDSLFAIWQRAIGVPDDQIDAPVWSRVDGHNVARVGAYVWDYDLNGQRVGRITNTSGGQSDISPRLTKSDMALWLRAGIETMRQHREMEGA